MAMSLNRVQLIGNLTKDPELRQIPGGQTVASFSIATNFSWTDQSGQRQEKAEYHNIVAWRKLADICGQYLRKGSKVFLEGRIQTREWEGEDGVKRYRTEIVAENMIMLDRKGEMVMGAEQGFGGGINKKSENGDAVPAAALSEEDVTIDDLPF
jgi:single-strand DNA-binding protein